MNASLACIGGIAAHNLLCEYNLITKRLGPQATPYGDSQPISICETPYGPYLFCARYGETGKPVPPRYVNYRANLYALKTMNVRHLVAWSDSKAISHNYRVGQFVLVDDLIDETVKAPMSFFETLDLAHIRQWPVFCPTLTDHLATVLGQSCVEFVERGVFVAVEGHRQETPAEARKFGLLGGDIIGRALAPEAFLAKELELSYAGVCYISHYAECGSTARPFERGSALDDATAQKRVAAAVAHMPEIMSHLLAHLNTRNTVKTLDAVAVRNIGKSEVELPETQTEHLLKRDRSSKEKTPAQ